MTDDEARQALVNGTLGKQADVERSITDGEALEAYMSGGGELTAACIMGLARSPDETDVMLVLHLIFGTSMAQAIMNRHRLQSPGTPIRITIEREEGDLRRRVRMAAEARAASLLVVGLPDQYEALRDAYDESEPGCCGYGFGDPMPTAIVMPEAAPTAAALPPNVLTSGRHQRVGMFSRGD